MSVEYTIRYSSAARRALGHELPENVATAAFEFITGALRKNPHRLGKQLRPPLFPMYSARRGEYRILYRINDGEIVIEIVSIQHRRDAYRK